MSTQKKKLKNVRGKSGSDAHKTKSAKSLFKYSEQKTTLKRSLVKPKNPLRNYNMSVVKSRCLRCIHLPLTHNERQKRDFVCYAGNHIELRNRLYDVNKICGAFRARAKTTMIGKKILSDISLDVFTLKQSANKSLVKPENPFYPEPKIKLNKLIMVGVDCALIKPIKENCLSCAWAVREICLAEHSGCSSGLYRKEHNISVEKCDNTWLKYLNAGAYYNERRNKKEA